MKNLLWLLFSLSCIISTVLSIFSLRIRKRKLLFLKDNNENGILEYQAQNSILVENLRAIGFGFFSVAGIYGYLFYAGDPLLPPYLALLASGFPLLFAWSSIDTIWREQTEHLMIKKKSILMSIALAS